MRRCCDLTGRFDRVGSVGRPAALSARRDRRGPRPNARPRRWRRSGWRRSGSGPSTSRQMPEDAELDRRSGRAARAALAPGRLGRALRAGRYGRLSQLGADERDPGEGGGRRAGGDGRAGARTGRSIRWCWPRPRIAGVDEMYRIGGAQAVAALAYGTASIASGRQDRRAGQRLCRRSEAAGVRSGRHRHDRRARRRSSIVAQAGVIPDWVAADMLSQAEHDERRASDPDHRRRGLRATRSVGAVERAAGGAARAEDRRRKLGEHGAILVVAPDRGGGAAGGRAGARASGADRSPPPRRWRRRCGTLARSSSGGCTPEVIGDYVGGPNHVLPTARTARFASGWPSTISSSGPRCWAATGPSFARWVRRRRSSPSRRPGGQLGGASGRLGGLG